MTTKTPPPASATGLVARITEVMNLPDASGKGLALTGQGYVLLHNIRAALVLSEEEREAVARVGKSMAAGDRSVFLADWHTIRQLIARTYEVEGE